MKYGVERSGGKMRGKTGQERGKRREGEGNERDIKFLTSHTSHLLLLLTLLQIAQINSPSGWQSTL
eukprot:766837-Hanusia_phi.AAC.3